MTSKAGNLLPLGISSDNMRVEFERLMDQLQAFIDSNTSDGIPSCELDPREILRGDPDDPLVTIVFRCEWPAKAQSRHIFIKMKPSIPANDFRAVVDASFQIVETGGTITETAATWLGEDPFRQSADNTPEGSSFAEIRDLVARSVGLDDPPQLKQVIMMMGLSVMGFMEVHVRPMEDVVICSRCKRQREISEWQKKAHRKSADKVDWMCEECYEEHWNERTQGMLDDVLKAEEEEEASRRLHAGPTSSG